MVINREEMKNLYQEGFSYAEIAKMYGVPRQVVRQKIMSKEKKLLPFMVMDGIKFHCTTAGYFMGKVDGEGIMFHRYIYEREHGKIPDGYLIHHIDGDPTNNSIDNLQRVTPAEHCQIHNLVYDFTEEQLVEMQELRKTTSVNDLAEKYGCSKSTIGLRAGTIRPDNKRHVVQVKRAPFTDEEILSMVEMHKTMTVKEISKVFKCRTDTVSAYLNELEKKKPMDIESQRQRTREYNLKYRENHKEELVTRDSERYVNNKEDIKARQKTYYENNREKVCEAARKYYRKNKKETL